MTMQNDDILDSLFHGCALAAYFDLLVATGAPPESEATRRLAYRYYEAELAIRQHRARR